jgi:hypothetical protein
MLPSLRGAVAETLFMATGHVILKWFGWEKRPSSWALLSRWVLS